VAKLVFPGEEGQKAGAKRWIMGQECLTGVKLVGRRGGALVKETTSTK
jgi:hypothetical protein